MSSVPEKQAGQSMSLHQDDVPPDHRDWLIALAFIGFALLLAILFAVYALAWDGGAHT